MSRLDGLASLANGGALERSAVPETSWEELAETIARGVERGLRVAALFGTREGEGARLFAVLADDVAGRLGVASSLVAEKRFPSLTPRCAQVHMFEREICEQLGLAAEGHPGLEPVRGEPAGRREQALTIGERRFFRVAGDEVHEVAVGPVHAGVIEPGHFRFQCHAEAVLHLEIALGYQHRGVERALLAGPGPRTIHYMETAAGDTTIGHALAYCQVLEALGGSLAPPRGAALRAVALELERVANHVGDLGALAGDVGFLPTASFCGRLRGDFLNATALLCGSRFGRGLVRPGGTRFDVDPRQARQLRELLAAARRDAEAAVELLWQSASVMARFEDVGRLPRDAAELLGIVGPPARASGIDRDVRRDHPAGWYRFSHIPVSLSTTGDVLGRAQVRWLEIDRSLGFVDEQLAALPEGAIRADDSPPLAPERLSVSLVEGWRGEICHAALTDRDGRFERYKLIDPSFHNWPGLAWAMRGQQISDFPLCNKSFNLSYCGHDL